MGITGITMVITAISWNVTIYNTPIVVALGPSPHRSSIARCVSLMDVQPVFLLVLRRSWKSRCLQNRSTLGNCFICVLVGRNFLVSRNCWLWLSEKAFFWDHICFDLATVLGKRLCDEQAMMFAVFLVQSVQSMGVLCLGPPRRWGTLWWVALHREWSISICCSPGWFGERIICFSPIRTWFVATLPWLGSDNVEGVGEANLCLCIEPYTKDLMSSLRSSIIF